MGGCCCSASQRAEIDRAPVYFYCPQELEENVSASHGASTAFPGGVLVDTNLDTSSPDTYQAPPAPLPYDFGSTRPQNTPKSTENHINSTDHVKSTSSLGGGYIADAGEDLKGHESKNKTDDLHDTPTVEEDDVSKLKDADPSTKDQEDVCPTCLEEYDSENPRIITKCEHHFHLSCILEWMERSNTCPICDQIMEIDQTCEE